jgi:hypothetical protein
MGLFGASKPAKVQYHGSSCTTQSCLDAIARLLAVRLQFNRAYLLTAQGRHGFFLDLIDEPEPICIRCGFTSGYVGEGPAGLAIALHSFRRFEVQVEEILVDGGLLTRIDESRLTDEDLRFVNEAPVVRPIRIYDYAHDGLRNRGRAETLVQAQFQPVVPWFSLDERLADLAVILSRDPDKAVFEGFRRLETQVRRRCMLPLDTVGRVVFQKAFRGAGALLTWPELPVSEIEGRAQLFEAAFMAYRNPRAHRGEGPDERRAYREFYLINELFLLEAEAVQV